MQFSYFFLLKSFSIPFHAYNSNYFLEIRTLQKCEALRKNCQIYTFYASRSHSGWDWRRPSSVQSSWLWAVWYLTTVCISVTVLLTYVSWNGGGSHLVSKVLTMHQIFFWSKWYKLKKLKQFNNENLEQFYGDFFLLVLLQVSLVAQW